VEAIPRLAPNLIDLDAVERAAGEAGPHSAVDLDGLGTSSHERAERAGGCRDHGSGVVCVLERSLVAETPDRRAHTLEAGVEGLRRGEPGRPGELAPELDADLAERFFTAACDQRVDEQPRE